MQDLQYLTSHAAIGMFNFCLLCLTKPILCFLSCNMVTQAC